eukprot:scaffold122043_cov15-Tisochrysis_lutea.AAC.2
MPHERHTGAMLVHCLNTCLRLINDVLSDVLAACPCSSLDCNPRQGLPLTWVAWCPGQPARSVGEWHRDALVEQHDVRAAGAHAECQAVPGVTSHTPGLEVAESC